MIFDVSLLNKEQKEATWAPEKRILCLAGAGTGKTRTLVTRIQRLLDEGVSAENILCLTFTRLAGLEMRNRIGEKGRDMFINTFHSFCYKVVEENLDLFRVNTNFTILTDEEKDILLTAVIEDLKLNVKKDLVEACLFSMEPLKQTKAVKEAEIASREYLYRLMVENAMDINILLFDVVKAFKENEKLREKYRKQYKYIFIDELQDTDDMQISFIESINPENLFLVGDDYQSIYGFRGARVEYILTLSKDPNYKVYQLTQNYRSTSNIIEAAENLIRNNKVRTTKSLIAHKNGDDVEYHELENEEKEADFVIKTIQESGRPLSDFTIISRTNKSIGYLSERMNLMKMPNRVLGKKIPVIDSVNTRKYLLLLEAARNMESHRIASQILETFYEEGESESIQMEALQKNISIEDVIMDREDAMSEFLLEVAMTEPLSLDVLHAHLLVSATDMVMSNLDTFELNELHSFMKKWKKAMLNLNENEDVSMMAFMNWMKMKNDADIEVVQRENYGEVVNLTTAHSSKGLEFPVVFLIGMNEDVFPILKQRKKTTLDKEMDKRRLSLSGFTPDLETEQVEEERRLAFVAVTRAKEKLYITRPKKTKNDWSLFEKEMKPSRFIKEMQGF